VIERSPLILVSLALLDLLRLLPEDVILPGLSLISQTIGGSRTLSTVLAWAVVAAVVYESIRFAYPADVSLTENHRGLRFVLTGFALAYAAALVTVNDAFLLVVGLGLFSASVIAIVRYFDSWTEWDLKDPDGNAAELLNRAVPGMADELRSELAYEGRRRTLGVGAWVVAFGVFLVIPCFLAGLATVILINAFPLPDVLLLTFALAKYGVVSVPEAMRNRLHLERRIYRTVGAATQSVKAAILVLVTALGGYLSAKFLSIAFPMLSTTAWALNFAIPDTAPEVWLIAWNLIGTTVVLVAAGLYSFWYWFRQFDRIPRFLELWERNPSGISGPTRPPWLTAPPTVGVALVVGFFLIRDANIPFVRPIFAVVWPLVVLGFVGCVVWTTRMDPQLPTDEDYAVVAAISMQYAGVWFGGTAEQIAAGRVSISAVVSLLFPVVAIVALVYLPDVFDFGRDHTAGWEFASVAYLFVFGAVAGVAALFTKSTALMFSAFAGICVLGAITIAIGKRLDA
jgi:hypothetical protein